MVSSVWAWVRSLMFMIVGFIGVLWVIWVIKVFFGGGSGLVFQSEWTWKVLLGCVKNYIALKKINGCIRL